MLGTPHKRQGTVSVVIQGSVLLQRYTGHERTLHLQLIALMVRKGRWELTGRSAHKPKINMMPWIRLASGPVLLRFTQAPL